MPRGYRCIVFAVVGWLSLANAAAPQPKAQPQQPEAQTNQASAAQPVALPPAKPVEPVQSPELHRPCNEGEEARNSDLCAQWKAADAARDAADWTFWGVIVGIVGTVGLIWTLYYTRKAVLAAEKGTKDAEAALAHVRQVARAELRPWLTYNGFDCHPFTNGYIGEVRFPYGLAARVNFINAGKTPAAKVSIFTATKVLPFDSDAPPFEPAEAVPGIGGSLGPNLPISGTDIGVGPDDHDNIMSRQSCLWLYSKASYEQPGYEGETFSTEICMRIAYNGEEVLPDGKTRQRFTASLEGPQNSLS